MKKLSYLLVGLFAFSTISCSDEDPNINILPGETIIVDPILEEITENKFEVIETIENEGIIGNEGTEAGTFTWSAAEGQYNGSIQYFIQIAPEGSEFKDGIKLFSAGVTDLTKSFTFGDLNNAANRLHKYLIANGEEGLKFGEDNNLEVRVMAVSQASQNTGYSNTVIITVNPYEVIISVKARLAVPGNHQGWNPDESATAFVPYISATSATDTKFEGYMWLDGEYKFVAANGSGKFEWGNTDYGDDNTFAGNLIEDGEVNCNATQAGFYQVKADLGNMTYSAILTNWGLIGDATPGSWDNSSPMTYNAATRTWSITIHLEGGKSFKFRANDAWDINFGDDGNNLSLEEGGENIPVATSGTYTIVLDLSSPRDYKYTITAN